MLHLTNRASPQQQRAPWTPPWRFIVTGIAVWLTIVLAMPAYAQVALVDIKQYQRINNGATFFTASAEEARFVDATLSDAYKSSGVSFAAHASAQQNTVPVHRFYNANTLAHFYTASETERRLLVETVAGRGWKYEGISFHAYTQDAPGRTPINRIWDGAIGVHRYVVGLLPELSPRPPASVVVEGVAFYGVKTEASTTPKAGRDAARFLTQATFGVQSAAQIQAFESQGAASWLTEQFSRPQTSAVDYLRAIEARGDRVEEQHPYEGIWQHVIVGDDQLRARITFALSQIIVVSNIAPDQNSWALAHWWDTLGKHGFGTYRELLEAITLHPAMGYYLNMMGNQKEDLATHRSPNENFAREVLQLFSIGINELNLDGTTKRDATGQAIPAYDQKTVEALAKVFTGWNHGGNNTADDAMFFHAKEAWMQPMEAWPAHHSAAAKQLFGRVAIPAGQTPTQDLSQALDAIANHPNVGPFLGRRLIQALVTSNPSAAYVARVSGVFNNNGNGLRGDMKAVLRAILLDDEARNPPAADATKFGKQREPVLRFTALLRGMGAKAQNGLNSVWWLESADDALGQSPLLSPSVFNFFSPNYSRAGAIAKAGLVSPEFQITTETQLVGSTNFLHGIVLGGGFGYRDEGKLLLDFARFAPLEKDAVQLVDALALIYTNGQLSDATRNIIVEAVSKQGMDSATRTKTALVLLMSAPEFVIQR